MIDRLVELEAAARLGKNPTVDADLAHELYGAITARDDYEALSDVLDDIIEQSGINATEDYAHDVRDLSLRFLAVRNAVAKLNPDDPPDLATMGEYREHTDAFFAKSAANEATLNEVRNGLIRFGAITADDTTTDLAQMVAMLLPPS